MSASKEFNEKVDFLHNDLIAGRLTASAQIAELLLPKIYKALVKKFSNVIDEHLIQTAANNAILYYLKYPNKFEANRGSLINFVWQLAKSGLLNLLSSKENILNHNEFVELNEAETVYSNETRQDETIEQFLIIDEQDRQIYKQLYDLIPDPLDRAILELMMNGERDTALFAVVLGVSDESLEERRACVKKHKDRIKKFIQRHRAEIIR
jgi:RNA polymerase sigma-70 factor (ECF subfamily)